MYADVLIELKVKSLDKTFTYIIPEDLKDKVKVGIRVIVPFGKQKLEGFVLSIENKKDIDYEIKKIIECIDEEPVLTNEMLELGSYISKKCLCTKISAYQTMLPVALKAHHDFNVSKKYYTYVILINENYECKNNNQREIIDLLKNNKVLKSELTKMSVSSYNTLLKNNVIKEIKEETYRLDSSFEKEKSNIILTEEQKNVVNKVKENLNIFKPFLLHGVTGSGKTEVYMNIIEEVLKLKKEIIVLVPEISLTPQMVNLFKNRFGNSIAILHSGLSNGEKYDEYRKIQKKEVSIVIGARSAIFAPFTNIGLIILDEEHSDTYKQENNPKYNAIDIAIKRAKTHNCPVIFGSATPQIESYTRAKQNIYELLELPNRINKTLPDIKIIDMKGEYKKGNFILSSILKEKIEEKLNNNEQVILFLNRRGYSTSITCRSCGETIKCPNCDIPLTYHKKTNKLNCHYCNYTTYKPDICPSCKEKELTNFGLGTEKLEEEVNKLFPKAKTIRMDIDTTGRKGSHGKILKSFKNNEYNVLIGTQMISKGLDFPLVTLVGVINADSSLNIPDFRSGERTFDLISQVSGRSGRSNKNGEVIIQAFNTTHYSILLASKNDYKNFYLEEMDIRKKLKYPPYYDLCLIRLTGYDYNELNKEANIIRKYLDDNLENVIILGPTLSNMPKINNKYYMQLILKYKNIKNIYGYLDFINNKLKSNTKVSMEIDFNPKKL